MTRPKKPKGFACKQRDPHRQPKKFRPVKPVIKKPPQAPGVKDNPDTYLQKLLVGISITILVLTLSFFIYHLIPKT